MLISGACVSGGVHAVESCEWWAVCCGVCEARDCGVDVSSGYACAWLDVWWDCVQWGVLMVCVCVCSTTVLSVCVW